MALTRPPLNLQPLGLLEAFGIKSGGEYPQDLLPALQPTIDLNRWYGETNAIDIRLTYSGGIVSSAPFNIYRFLGSAPISLNVDPVTSGITVPNTEVWQVLDYTVQWQFTAAASQSLAGPLIPCAIPTQGGAVFIRGIPFSYAGALTSDAARIVGGASVSQRETFLKPGDALGFALPGVTLSAALSVTGYMRFRPFRI